MPTLLVILWSFASLLPGGQDAFAHSSDGWRGKVSTQTAFSTLTAIRRAQNDHSQDLPPEESLVADQSEPGENESRDISKLSGMVLFIRSNSSQAFSGRAIVLMSLHPDRMRIERTSTSMRC